MHNYNLTECKSSLETTKTVDDILLQTKITETKVYRDKLGKTQGMKLMKYHTITNVYDQLGTSHANVKLLSYLITHQGKDGIVRTESNKDNITVDYLADTLSISTKTVQRFLSSMKKLGMLKKHVKAFYLNPHVVTPYAISNDRLGVLQVYWDSNFTRDISPEVAELRSRNI